MEVSDKFLIYIKIKCLNIVPQPKTEPSGSILVCSDDQLIAIGVKKADHIIHYDLPDDLDTFSRRYSVFERSHCKFQVFFKTKIFWIFKKLNLI